MTQHTTSNEPGERTDRQRRDGDDPIDPVYGRRMSLEEIKAVYAERAALIHRLEPVERLLTARYRRQQFGDVDGRVLDVACGTGTNVRYLSEPVEFVGVDVSPEMVAKARDGLERIELEGEFRRMDAQALEFPDDRFDTVISTFSTCTFPDPVAALEEMARVCTPDGRILLVEHGRSSVEPIARLQEWRADEHYRKTGCRSIQEPLELVSRAGLSVRETSSELFGIVTTIEARPN